VRALRALVMLDVKALDSAARLRCAALSRTRHAHSDKLALDVLKSADWNMEARARSVTHGARGAATLTSLLH
jgi:hypothetical protein